MNAIDERIAEVMQAAWRPIETAPSDGTAVLLYVPPDEFGEVDPICVGYWERPDYNSKEEWVYGPNGYEHYFRSYAGKPTHWMPLPKPPSK